MTLGQIMQNIRKEKGYTQKQLAEKCGLATGTIQQYELNKREPRREQLQKIATALNVPLYELMGFDGSIRVKGDKQRPFDIAIQKIQNKEDLTCEEETAIIEYVESEHFRQEKEDIKQLAQKAHDYISFLHSHSYASSAEEFDKLYDAKQIDLEKEADNNIPKYHGSIRISPETIEISKKISIIYDKIKNKEELNENDLQVLKDYDQRQKIAMKRLEQSLHSVQEKLKSLMALHSAYDKLNEVGQEEAAKRIEELTELSRYTKPDEPPQE